MLFCYNGSHITFKRRVYLNNYNISCALLGNYYYNKSLTPNTPSAIDKNKYISLKKMHQEYLERTRVGHNHMDEECKTFNIIDGSIKVRKRSDFTYGFNPSFGNMDTTGTASGVHSKDLINKAVNELIEKNEVLLIWYLEKGYQLQIDDEVKKLINQTGFYSDEIFIFMSNSIANIYTFAVVLFKNHEIMATGISLDEDERKGLQSALKEAKLLESINLCDKINPYKREFTKLDYEQSYEKICELSRKFEKINVNQLSVKKRIIASWVHDLEVAILNVNPNQQFTTIRCCSEDLINAIPNKEYLLNSRSTILSEYGITKEIIEDRLENIFI